MTTTRRGFITGIASLLAAPPIVRATSIMPVKPLVVTDEMLARAWFNFPIVLPNHNETFEIFCNGIGKKTAALYLGDCARAS